MALDVGSRTIGLAVTDPLGFTAQGLITIRRKNKRTDLAALKEVIAKYGVVELVVGLPLRMSGAEGRQSEKMREFVAVLRTALRPPDPSLGRAADLGGGQSRSAGNRYVDQEARRRGRSACCRPHPAELDGGAASSVGTPAVSATSVTRRAFGEPPQVLCLR